MSIPKMTLRVVIVSVITLMVNSNLPAVARACAFATQYNCVGGGTFPGCDPWTCTCQQNPSSCPYGCFSSCMDGSGQDMDCTAGDPCST
jgi:hypothetical protein